MIKKYIFSWYAVCFYAAVIVIGSVVPLDIAASSEIDFLDKAVHFIVYLLFAFMILNTALLYRVKHFRMVSFLAAFILGLTIECVQLFLPFRNFEIMDIVVNFLGAFAGMFLRIVR